MSKLLDYYKHRAAIESTTSLSPINKMEWDKLEEALIQEEVLPEVLNSISDILMKVKSSLDIRVCYSPGGMISISASRSQMQIISHSAPIALSYDTPEEEHQFTHEDESVTNNTEIVSASSHTEYSDKITRSKSIGFKVTFLDGTVVKKGKAVDTFLASLQKIGINKIAAAKHGIEHGGFSLVGKKASKEPNIQKMVDGWYVYTHMSNEAKIKDLKLLSDFFNLGLLINWDKEKSSSAKQKKEEKPGDKTRDNTKFSFNGSSPLPKTKLALAIVHQYVADNPDITYSKLRSVFPDSLIGGKLGTIKSLEDIPLLSEAEKKKRYMMKEEELILLEDAIVVVCSQWRENIHDMIEIGKRLGYTIEEV